MGSFAFIFYDPKPVDIDIVTIKSSMSFFEAQAAFESVFILNKTIIYKMILEKINYNCILN